ncbi:hypothetical protein LARV_03159 [Longilinea arvoryzae]|uniref:Zinc ribbon domain-containing protein n=1 Tax=Longilinea arvoryzae TaxID=360412 RepID=A0A0S7BI07_9CHLR|nr:zinc ribbon domain-containing protein [Longilinea arvoryzae]GAP15373.1 hypothetical protein LARV_03159 [Longilinea arvoryzae]
MADIRCSKCQTLNPAGATVCKNCGQPLADESISWLDSLRSGTASSAWEEPETNAKAAEDAQPEDTPDWLQRIRQHNQEEQARSEPPAPAEEPSEDLPEWLRDIQQSSSGQSTGSETGGNADWLQNLRSSESAMSRGDSGPSEIPAAGSLPFASEPSEESGEDTPDWMKNLESWKAGKEAESTPPDDFPDRVNPDQPSAPANSAFEEDDQEWLTRLSRQSSGQPSAAGSSDSDWAAGLQTGSESSSQDAAPEERDASKPAAEEPPASAAESSDLDWLSSLQAVSGPAAEDLPAEEQPAVSGEDFDWMSRLSGETPSTEPDSGAASNPFSSSDFPQSQGEGFSWEGEIPGQEPPTGDPPETPDWLRAFGTHQPVMDSGASSEHPFESSLPEEGESGQPSGELPDWLSKFSSQEPERLADETQPDSTGESKPNVPDWLNNFPSTEPEPPAAGTQAEFTGQPEPTEPENVPAWLNNFPGQAPEQPAAEMEASPESTEEPKPSEPENVPDWLKQYPPAEQTSQPAEPVAPISEEPQNEKFTWQSLGIQEPSEAEKPEEAATDLPFAGANLPEWLDQAGSAEPRLPLDEELIPPAKPASESETPTPFAQSEIPDWLGESGPAAAAAQAAGEHPAESSDKPLEAAELPSWLQSMRPIETVAPKPISAEEKRIEKAGPLAGISGVLPTEDLVGQYIKPPLYTVKLRVSEKQRVHASLIESLIGEETQSQAIPAERSEAPKRVLRFLVAIVLILAILLPMLNILPSFPAPDILPQELVAFEQVMSDETIIPQGSAVLLALEYEPGLSGEMQTASEAVIRQLAERNVSLTVISTSPTGSILAESLLNKAKFDSAKVVNLGYLAGGSTGLQSFGLSPVQAAPATLQGQLAPWNSGILAGITHLSDFAATIVLTDDPDKGRTWVEQIQPTLDGKPMLMVSSAQAAPLLLPYYNSGQVKGIISGINGAAGYESLVQSSGTATLLRGSYQYGMLLAAVLILVGGLITAIASSITRGKAEKGA